MLYKKLSRRICLKNRSNHQLLLKQINLPSQLVSVPSVILMLLNAAVHHIFSFVMTKDRVSKKLIQLLKVPMLLKNLVVCGVLLIKVIKTSTLRWLTKIEIDTILKWKVTIHLNLKPNLKPNPRSLARLARLVLNDQVLRIFFSVNQ